jgi:hypothetical protein
MQKTNQHIWSLSLKNTPQAENRPHVYKSTASQSRYRNSGCLQLARQIPSIAQTNDINAPASIEEPSRNSNQSPLRSTGIQFIYA